MRIVAISGVQKSGKTTTTEYLVSEFKRRGFKVGTVKNIGCPSFTLENKPNGNTARHRRAGADIVCANAKGETDFMATKAMDMNEIFAVMEPQVDILLLEGDRISIVPRIICAHTESEVKEEILQGVIAVSGRIADAKETVLSFPAVSAVGDVEQLADLILEKTEEITLPVRLLPHREGRYDYCQTVCRKGCGAPVEKKEISGGEKASSDKRPAKALAEKILITGGTFEQRKEKLTELLNGRCAECIGLYVKPLLSDGKVKGYCLHGEGALPEGFENDIPAGIRLYGEGPVLPVPEILDTFGAECIRSMLAAARAGDGDPVTIVVEELGVLERDAGQYRKAIRDLMESEVPCIMTVGNKKLPYLKGFLSGDNGIIIHVEIE